MSRIKISKEELEMMAEKLELPLNEEVFENTRNTVENWINGSMIFAEKMMDPRFQDVYPYYAVKR